MTEEKTFTAPEGASLQVHSSGKGALIVDGRISPTAQGFREVAPGICPRCETKAEPWEPPMFDGRYQRRVAQIREVQKLETDQEAHKAFLRSDGGFIHICTKCGTSFWVPYQVAEIALQVMPE